MIIYWAREKSQWRFRGPHILAGIFHPLTFQLKIWLFWNSDLCITYGGSVPGGLHHRGAQHKDTATISFPNLPASRSQAYRIYGLGVTYFQDSSVILVCSQFGAPLSLQCSSLISPLPHSTHRAFLQLKARLGRQRHSTADGARHNRAPNCYHKYYRNHSSTTQFQYCLVSCTYISCHLHFYRGSSDYSNSPLSLHRKNLPSLSHYQGQCKNPTYNCTSHL